MVGRVDLEVDLRKHQVRRCSALHHQTMAVLVVQVHSSVPILLLEAGALEPCCIFKGMKLKSEPQTFRKKLESVCKTNQALEQVCRQAFASLLPFIVRQKSKTAE